MPTNVVKTERDEHLWNKAKAIVKKSYPNIREDSPRFYKLTMGIYQKMRGKKD